MCHSAGSVFSVTFLLVEQRRTKGEKTSLWVHRWWGTRNWTSSEGNWLVAQLVSQFIHSTLWSNDVSTITAIQSEHLLCIFIANDLGDPPDLLFSATVRSVFWPTIWSMTRYLKYWWPDFHEYSRSPEDESIRFRWHFLKDDHLTAFPCGQYLPLCHQIISSIHKMIQS